MTVKLRRSRGSSPHPSGRPRSRRLRQAGRDPGSPRRASSSAAAVGAPRRADAPAAGQPYKDKAAVRRRA